MKCTDKILKKTAWIIASLLNRQNDFFDPIRMPGINRDQISEILIPVNRSTGYSLTWKVSAESRPAYCSPPG